MEAWDAHPPLLAVTLMISLLHCLMMLGFTTMLLKPPTKQSTTG